MFWPEVRRGSERTIRELAVGLVEAGHEPLLLTSHPSPRVVEWHEGFKVVKSRRPSEKLVRRAGYYEYLSHVPGQYRSLARADGDLAHAFYVSDAAMAGKWGRRNGRPVVFSCMGVARPEAIAERRGRKLMWRMALDGADAVVALSEAAARPIRAMGVEPWVIYPGVALQDFSPSAERHERPTVYFAGDAADPRKRIELMLEAFAVLRRTLPDACLMAERPADPMLAARMASQPGVELLDGLEGAKQLARIYSEAWVTSLPAVQEAFGRVLVESMACGTPVVGTRDGAIPEVITSDEVGRLFQGGAEDLAATLLEAIELGDSPSTAEACREHARRFSSEKSLAHHLELYRNLLAS